MERLSKIELSKARLSRVEEFLKDASEATKSGGYLTSANRSGLRILLLISF